MLLRFLNSVFRLQPVVERLAPPAVVVFPFWPYIFQMRHNFFGKQLAGIARLPVRHIANMHQAEDMSDMHIVEGA